MKLVIELARWCRGEDDTALIRHHDGRMCCLGFLGAACGIPDSAMLGKVGPGSARHANWPEWLSERADEDSVCSSPKYQLMTANDDQQIDEPARQEKIAAIFAKHGVEVEFVG